MGMVMVMVMEMGVEMGMWMGMEMGMEMIMGMVRYYLETVSQVIRATLSPDDGVGKVGRERFIGFLQGLSAQHFLSYNASVRLNHGVGDVHEGGDLKGKGCWRRWG